MSHTEEPTLLEISARGSLKLSAEQLQQAGLVPGDQLVISAPAPGHLYLHRIDPLYTGPLSHEALSQLMHEAFEQSGYKTREQIVNLVREVRQEMAKER
jgi:tRNA G26 N,N-dimethylase Trm1